MGRLTPPPSEAAAVAPLLLVVVHVLLLAAAVSALPAINVTTMAFEDGYAPLFGHGNILRSADHRTVSLLLDRSTGHYYIINNTLHPLSIVALIHPRWVAEFGCGLHLLQGLVSSPRPCTSTASSAPPSSSPPTTPPASSSPST